MEAGSGAGPSRLPAWSSRDGYDVGQIPYEEGVSPSGARTYTIPITIAQNVKLAPSLSLVYNSQSGAGYAGYGWDIGGLSYISIANKTRYYDGQAVAARYDDTDAAWTLDGVPLAQNDDAAFSNYQYKTAREKIYVKKNTDAQGLPSSFEALYPDGSSAVFQWPVSYQDGHTVFPMVMRQDREGNVVTYEYSASNTNSPYLYAVNYGGKDQSSPPCRIDLYPQRSFSGPQQKIDTESLLEKDIKDISDDFRIRYEVDNTPSFDQSDLKPQISIERPRIKGYIDNLDLNTDLYHRFPRVFDEDIINYGVSYARISDGSNFIL